MNFDQIKEDRKKEVIISRCTMHELIENHEKVLAEKELLVEALALAKNELDAGCHAEVIGKIDAVFATVGAA